jgi:uncharacterized protein YoxC
MTSTSGLLIAVLALAVAVRILSHIPVLLELRRTVRTLNGVLKITEESLAPTLRELRSTLENLDRITSDISTVTDDVRVFSGSLRQVGKDVRELSGLVGALGGHRGQNGRPARRGRSRRRVSGENLLRKRRTP